MFVLEDITAIPNGGIPLSALPGVNWRGATSQANIRLSAIVLKFEGLPPAPPAPLLEFDVSTVIPKVFNTIPNTHTIADI
jgi:hypothetical protein